MAAETDIAIRNADGALLRIVAGRYEFDVVHRVLRIEVRTDGLDEQELATLGFVPGSPAAVGLHFAVPVEALASG